MKHDLFEVSPKDIPAMLGLGALAVVFGVTVYIWLCVVIGVAP